MHGQRAEKNLLKYWMKNFLQQLIQRFVTFYSEILHTMSFLFSSLLTLSSYSLVRNSRFLFILSPLSGAFSSKQDWPPIFDNPWASQSLHELWGKRWHQLLRRTFLVCGGYPGYWIAGNTGMILGSFFASGMFHQIYMVF